MKFKLNRNQESAQKPGSQTGKSLRFFRKLFDRHRGQEQQSASAGTTPASANSDGSVVEGPSPNLPGTSNDSPESTQSLWGRAYETLEEQSPDLVKRYLTVLVGENTGTAACDDGELLDQRRFLAICKSMSARMEDNKSRVGEQIANAAEFLLWAKGLVDEAVKVSPEASLVWAGVSIVLPLLTNPIAAEENNQTGFTYVTTRMRYYAELERQLISIDQQPNARGFLAPLEDSFLKLYAAILEFQIKSVLRFHQSGVRRYWADLRQSENWVGMRKSIGEFEATVNKDIRQQIELLTFQDQTKATILLDSLQKTSSQDLENMEKLLSVSQQQLKATQAHLVIAQERLSQQEQEIQRHQLEKREKCHQLFRLSSSDKDTSYEWYKGRVEDRIENTCQWFLTRQSFTEWQAQESGMLLVSADPGCGKSVLAKHLIDHVLNSTTVCYFFFKDQDQNTIRQALCAVLHQLFSQRPSLIEHAMQDFSKNGPGLVNTPSSLWEIFDRAVQDQQAGPVVVVLDALDECAESEIKVLLQRIQAFFLDSRRGTHKLKVLMTSRPYQQIVSEYEGLPSFGKIHISGEQSSDDIAEEINRVIKHRIGLLGLPEKVATSLTTRLLEIPHKTYLWVHLVFENIKAGEMRKTLTGVKLMVDEIPKNVNDAYEQILKKSKNREGALRAMAIMLAAQRPLTLSEMNVAVNVQEDNQTFDDLDLEDDEDFKSTLRAWCGLFISIHHGKVYFLHQTARTFLLADSSSSTADQPSSCWNRCITQNSAHATLAKRCVHYLALLNSVAPSHDEINDAFLDYSAKHWGLHFRQADFANHDGLIPIALAISDPVSRSFSAWCDIYRGYSYAPGEGSSSLHVSSNLGHSVLVKLLLETEKVDVNAKDELGQTPLLWAARNGYEAIVKLLLETEKVDVNAKDELGQTPLSWAAMYGYEAIVKLLLETEKVDVDAKDVNGWTPLSLAASDGYEAVVKLLLETEKVDVNVKDMDGQTPLSLAAMWGREGVVKLLREAQKDEEYSKDATTMGC